MGWCLCGVERFEEALGFFERSENMWREMHKDLPADAEHLHGHCLSRLGRYEQAVGFAQEYLETVQRLSGGNQPHLKALLLAFQQMVLYLANVRPVQGISFETLDYAIKVSKVLLPQFGEHPDVADSLRLLGECLCLLGRFSEAQEYYQQGLEMQLTLSQGSTSPRLADSVFEVGYCLEQLGRFNEAVEH